jgi:hypothetical protein
MYIPHKGLHVSQSLLFKDIGALERFQIIYKYEPCRLAQCHHGVRLSQGVDRGDDLLLQHITTTILNKQVGQSTSGTNRHLGTNKLRRRSDSVTTLAPCRLYTTRPGCSLPRMFGICPRLRHQDVSGTYFLDCNAIESSRTLELWYVLLIQPLPPNRTGSKANYAVFREC